MTRHRPGRRSGEVAVLADGPWANCTYYRDDLEAQQHAAELMGYPLDHPSAAKRLYGPTDEFEAGAGPDSAHPVRRWRYRRGVR